MNHDSDSSSNVPLAAPNVPLDESGDLRRIREMILRKTGKTDSPATTIVLVEMLLEDLKGD